MTVTTDSASGTPLVKADAQRIDTPSETYLRMQARWQVCRDLMEGTAAIRRNAALYLPQMEGESDGAWAARIKLGALFNGFERTVLASVGMLSVSDPILSDDMPPELVALADDVDGAGTALSIFSSELVQHAIVDGHAGIFVDMPEAATDAPIDGDTAKRLGLRPYFILVTAEDEWLPFYEVVNGGKQLTMLVRRVRASRRVGAFGLYAITEFWLYVLTATGVEYARYVQDDAQQARIDPAFANGPRPMRGVTSIPYARLVAGQALSSVETKPTLLTLADLNVEHHQTKNGILSLESLAFTPTQVRIGAQQDKDGRYPEITNGPKSVIEAPYLQGVTKPVYWDSPDVSVITPAMQTLDKTELAMEVSGAAFLSSQTRAQETAAAKKINARAQHATLAVVARARDDCLNNAFFYAGQFLNVVAGTVTVPRDFDDTTLDPQVMVAYVNAVANAGLPPRILLQAWQKGGRIDPDVDLTELEAEMMAAQDAAAAAKAMDAALQAGNTDPNADPNALPVA